MKKLILIITIITCLNQNSYTAYAKENYNICRINGQDRYETSINIANNFNNGTVQNVIVASGDNFPDALAGSVLSNQLNAPILLVDKSLSGSQDSINYIKSHLDTNGTVYILGGSDSVSNEYVDYIKLLGFNNVKRLGGKNRFDTNRIIVENLNVEKGKPVVIVNGNNFPDALSISSIASLKGYPIMLSNENSLSEEIKGKISEIQPSTVYLIGGEGALNNNIIAEVKNLVTNIEDTNIIRISGQDRYETSLNICKNFGLNTDTVVIANGENFPDALSGSALAAKLQAPIIITNGYDISNQKSYLDTTSYKNLILLGGQNSICEDLESKLTDTKNVVDSNNIPTLKVLSNDKNINAIIGTYSWTTDNKDGTKSSINVDSIGPEELVKESTPLIVSSNSQLTLSFSDKPLDINVGIWSDNKIVSQEIINNGIKVSKSKGLEIYIVNATWKQGTISYTFLVNVT